MPVKKPSKRMRTVRFAHGLHLIYRFQIDQTPDRRRRRLYFLDYFLSSDMQAQGRHQSTMHVQASIIDLLFAPVAHGSTLPHRSPPHSPSQRRRGQDGWFALPNLTQRIRGAARPMGLWAHWPRRPGSHEYTPLQPGTSRWLREGTVVPLSRNCYLPWLLNLPVSKGPGGRERNGDCDANRRMVQ